jgi:hypothetical protein
MSRRGGETICSYALALSLCATLVGCGKHTASMPTKTETAKGLSRTAHHVKSCDCHPVVVGSGYSRGGQRWVHRYGIDKLHRNWVLFSMSNSNCEDPGCGYALSRRGLSHLGFPLFIGHGTAQPDPTSFNGVTSPNVSTITFQFRARPPVTVHPYLASERLRQRFPFLREIRFYTVFFEGDYRTLRRATAYDATGRTLKTQRFSNRPSPSSTGSSSGAGPSTGTRTGGSGVRSCLKYVKDHAAEIPPDVRKKMRAACVAPPPP